jgi:hypothetical protein
MFFINGRCFIKGFNYYASLAVNKEITMKMTIYCCIHKQFHFVYNNFLKASDNIAKLLLNWSSDLTEWYPLPRLQYYDVQTLECRYISKLPMKNEWIWSWFEIYSFSRDVPIFFNSFSAYWIFMKLYTVVVHILQMCMKEYHCCLKFRRGDNSTYTFTKMYKFCGKIN